MPLPVGQYLIDTSVLIRLDEPASPLRPRAIEALKELSVAGVTMHLAPQSLVEFWAVATRPVAKNGLGMTLKQAETRHQLLKNQFTILPETPAIFPVWESLVVAAGVSGKQVHDTRLAAFMAANALSHILTFNVADFRRFEPIIGIVVVEPI